MKHWVWLYLFLNWIPMEVASQPDLSSTSLRVYTIRLVPGEDVKEKLDEFVAAHRIEAGFILSAVGSLTQHNIRLANQDSGSRSTGYFELVSLVGTISMHGSHVHLSVSDTTGKTIGGHLLDQNKVYTTMELVIGVLPDMVYQREPDSASGYKELKVYKKKRK